MQCLLFGKSLLLCLVVLLFPFATGAVHALTGSVSLSTGYRVDALDWSIAFDFAGTTPNILSELTWTDLEIYQVGAEAEIMRPINERVSVVYLGQIAYGFVLSGDNQDSDYAGDNRTLEWSRSNNDAGDGEVFDFSGGVGLRFFLPDRKWALTPQLGYAYFEQDLVMQDGVQTISDPTIASANGFPAPVPVGPFSGLDSSYYAWWYGPWIGFEVAHQSGQKFSWDISARWHRVDYGAQADWNLRTDLKHPVSFEHEADGDGVSIDLGLNYLVDQKWDAQFAFGYTDFQTGKGLDIVYLDSGLIGGTRLNEVNWESWAASFSLRYRF